MKATIIGYTTNHLEDKEKDLLENFKAFSGAQAGICYMKDKYFGTYVTDFEKAVKRFDTIIPTGHHSIADHVQITLLLEGISKIGAIYMNNLNCYETSEKSGRYTEMTGNSEIERELYEKWNKIFSERIIEVYGERIDIKTVDKLAKENARYILSVFTPTTMSYTTSLKQWNYIMDWLEKYDYEQFEDGYFKDNLKREFTELRKEIEIVRISSLRENKNRKLNLIDNDRIYYAKEQFGETYAVKYEVTFVGYAQLQRHRTLKYNLGFNGKSIRFYVPQIIRGNKLEEEWLTDMQKVLQYVPQGTSVAVLERGDTEDFFLKAKERLCGRAQIEVTKQTQDTLMKMYRNRINTSKYIRKLIESYVDEDKPKTKCQLLSCKEPCIWGRKEALTREI